MGQKNILIGISLIIALLVAGYFFLYKDSASIKSELDPTPKAATLSGTYVCLPHLDTSGPQTMECAFGLKTDEGDYYAVDLGQASTSLDQFQTGKHIKAEGTIVIKEALSSSQWFKYNMKGIFTITKIIEPTQVSGKININEVCQNAIAYMSFPDGKSAELWIKDCIEGKHPEVIEQYIKQMNLSDGAAI
ncbi:MAG TPA: hypothetical protein VGC58_00555 [Candidatus Paceibacterota bacterium]